VRHTQRTRTTTRFDLDVDELEAENDGRGFRSTKETRRLEQGESGGVKFGEGGVRKGDFCTEWMGLQAAPGRSGDEQ
jgi:hypothetical protein